MSFARQMEVAEMKAHVFLCNRQWRHLFNVIRKWIWSGAVVQACNAIYLRVQDLPGELSETVLEKEGRAYCLSVCVRACLYV